MMDRLWLLAGLPLTLAAAGTAVAMEPALQPAAGPAEIAPVGNRQILWQNVQAGMTPDEVRAAQPQAEIQPNLKVAQKVGPCYLRIASFVVNNDRYAVCFDFKNGALDQVRLIAFGRPKMAQYNSIMALLRARYGAERETRQVAGGYHSVWEFSNSYRIMVQYQNLIPPRDLTISYSLQTDMGEKSKL